MPSIIPLGFHGKGIPSISGLSGKSEEKFENLHFPTVPTPQIKGTDTTIFTMMISFIA